MSPASAAVAQNQDSGTAPADDQGTAPETPTQIADNAPAPDSGTVSANDLSSSPGAPSAPTAATAADDSGLPFTGQDVLPLVALAIALLAGGVLLRRRTRDSL